MFIYKKINKQINLSYNIIYYHHYIWLQYTFAAWRAVCTRALKDSPLHGDERLLAIPASCYQVSDNNQNLNYF